MHYPNDSVIIYPSTITIRCEFKSKLSKLEVAKKKLL